jgi:hypothetical protein
MKKIAEEIRDILLYAREKAYNATAFAMIEGYWKIGKRSKIK